MSEHPTSAPKGGLPAGFSLGNIVNDPTLGTEWNDHDAVLASQRIWDDINLDPKTGLLKQEAWMTDLAEAISHKSHDQDVIVHIGDLDGFKSLNDSLGHAAGDEFLGLAGEAFALSFKRKTDIIAHGSREGGNKGVARLGGDEYAVYEVIDKNDPAYTDNWKRDIENAADQSAQSERVNKIMQQLMEGTKFEKFPVSVSIGSARLPDGGTALDAYALADYNMFIVKYQKKVDQISPEDRIKLRDYTIPHLKSIGARVETWLETAALKADDLE